MMNTRTSFGASSTAFGASRPINGSSTCSQRYASTTTPAKPYGGSAMGGSAAYASPRAPMSAADELRALRTQNEQLQRQLALKDQGLERLRQKVTERALLLSHQQAADVQQTRREAGSVIGELEAENAKLRADLAHRTSQLHSAVTRIGALKSRIDDLILQNDELQMQRDRAQKSRVAARRRAKALKEAKPGVTAQRDAMASLVGTQDSMLNLIEDLSFLPPDDDAVLEPPPQRPSALAAMAAAKAVKAAAAAAGGDGKQQQQQQQRGARASYAAGAARANAAAAAAAARSGAAVPAGVSPDEQYVRTLATPGVVPPPSPGAPRADGAGGGGDPPVVVPASNVTIAKRTVPVVAWAPSAGSGAEGGGGPEGGGGGGGGTGALAAVATAEQELRSRLGDRAHSRLAQFEGRFGAPERIDELTHARRHPEDGRAPEPATARVSMEARLQQLQQLRE